jgi:1-acyl-sn-glycerol-3-phosphate acyltransferase
MQDALRFFRALIFYVVFISFTTVFCLSALFFIWFLPFKTKFAYLSKWNVVTIFLSKYLAGINYRVTGKENIPTDQPYIVLAKHQSQWETFFLLLLFKPVSIILKKELFHIPGFGWGLRMIKPIPIDRSNPKQAMKQIQRLGLERLKEDKLPILIFPEGTRMPFGKAGKYARGGAALAIAADVPLLFVTHNAGYFWPADKFLKNTGTVDVIISKPVYPKGRTALELTNIAQEWIESHLPPLDKA